MQTHAGIVLTALAGAAGASMAAGAAGLPDAPERDLRMLAAAMLPAMPEAQREAIVAAGGIGSEEYLRSRPDMETGDLLVAHDERYERLRGVVSPALFARMRPEHLGMFLHTIERHENGQAPNLACFAPGTDPELVWSYSELFRAELWSGPQEADERFQIGARWTFTATDGAVSQQGTPITITYSFAPDGAVADNLVGQNRSNSLNSWLTGLYGNSATWQNLFAQVFNRWGDLIGVTYVRETNDDGIEANTGLGQLGVRGDVRIFAVPLDGNFGVLAYNQFPNGGDMVFDTGDSFYNSFSSNSRRLRNVASHEHGHGLGFEHVCPQNGTKLMEPSANTNFDGPQLDDILAGQRNYGDYLEPNNNSASATDAGSIFNGASVFYDLVSIDDNSDVDYYRVQTTQPLELVVTVDLDGATYSQGPQTQSCNSGTITNYNDNLDLEIRLLSSNGTTQVAFVDDNGFQQGEELRATLTTPGTYYVVVDDQNTLNRIQPYQIRIEGGDIPFDGPTIVPEGELVGIAAPGTAPTVEFNVQANADSIIDGPDLLYRLDGGAFTRVPMSNVGGNVFSGSFPEVGCDDNPEYYIEVVGTVVGAVNFPVAGAVSPESFPVGELGVTFEDSFETATGWSDSLTTASTGRWDRGVPVSSPGAPPSDFDGSGQCYVTGNDPDEDVDFGRVFLRSPRFDATGGGVFSYAYWFSDGGTGFIGDDSMSVEISYNGQITWTELRRYTTPTAGWATDEFEIPSDLGSSDTYIRFIVEDSGTNNTVEGAVDAVVLGSVTCTEPQGCNDADVAEPFNVLDLGDINAFISAFGNQQPLADIAAPFGVWDLGDIGAFTGQFVAGCP